MKQGGQIYPPEFELMLACLRWPQRAEDGDRIRALAQPPLGWSYLFEIISHHKVLPLFQHNLQAFAADRVPVATATALRSSSVENAHACLQQTGELLSLNRRFREQGIDLRVFKGVPLAIAAFQQPTLRHAGDIDLLVSEKDIFAASEILRAAGYVRVEPQAVLTPRRLRSYLAHQKDFSYEHPVTGAAIDLHWRLFRNPWLPANARIEQLGVDWVDLGSERIPTLPAPSLLLYLCVHGALDGWLRLKWLADIGALLHSMSAEQLEAAAELAVARQALPEFSAAILLCHDLLGHHLLGRDMPGAQAMPAQCLDRSDPRVARILRFSTRLMTSNRCRPVREGIPGREWLLNEFLLQSGLRYRLNLIVRFLFRPRAWQRFDLPDALFPLYALLGPLDWLAFHLKRPLAKCVRAVRRWMARPRATKPHEPIPFRRILHTSPVDLGLAFEAGCMLTFFRIALCFVPVQKLTHWMGRPQAAAPPRSPGHAETILRRIEWSIDAVVRHAPLQFVCFPQSLAAYFMLRRRHIASRLFYGVARLDDRLTAHTWVKAGDRTVVGGEVEAQFTVLNVFP